MHICVYNIYIYIYIYIYIDMRREWRSNRQASRPTHHRGIQL